MAKVTERDMRPTVGGGTNVDKLADNDFVDSAARKFPIVTGQDVKDAVSSWGRYKGKLSFDDFKTRLIAIAKRKGLTDSLPQAWNAGMKEAVSLGQLDRAELNYMDTSTDQRDICAKCCHFIAGDPPMCMQIKGAISAEGWCKLYMDFDGDDEEVTVDGDPAGAEETDEPGEKIIVVPPNGSPIIVPESAPETRGFADEIDLTESQVDPEARVIRNVRLIKAGVSKNRHNYSEAVLQSAQGVFEGLKAYADHPRKPGDPRSVRDLTGWYQNARFENGALIADRYFTANAAGNDAWAIARDIAEGRAPTTLAGLSINAVGKGVTRKTDDGDVLDVESITYAHSVDDVDNPAAGGGYTLAAGVDPLIQAVFEAVSYEEWLRARADYARRARKEWQTVRLPEEVQRVLAESEGKLKTAEANANAAAAALQAAQGQIAAAEQARDTAADERLRAQVELALEKSRLPKLYTDDLRTRLLEVSPEQWAALIGVEQKKAARTGNNKRPSVTGADAQHLSAPASVAAPGGVKLAELLSDPEIFDRRLTERS